MNLLRDLKSVAVSNIARSPNFIAVNLKSTLNVDVEIILQAYKETMPVTKKTNSQVWIETDFRLVKLT